MIGQTNFFIFLTGRNRRTMAAVFVVKKEFRVLPVQFNQAHFLVDLTMFAGR